MDTIGAFVDICRSLTEEQFCKQYPHPVLLLATASSQLNPTDETDGRTMDRMIIGHGSRDEEEVEEQGDSGVTRASDAATPGNMYRVFMLVSRDARSSAISLGCSRSCDVQVNDASISMHHATVHHKKGTCYIEDTDSSAGTQVNDEFLPPGERRSLSTGDRVSLGYVDLTYLNPADFYRLVRQLYID